MARIVAIDRFWKDPFVASHLARHGHSLHLTKGFQECLDFQTESPADLIILSLPVLWGEMPLAQFFSELRKLTSVPVIGIGVEYQESLSDRTRYKGVKLREYLTDGSLPM
ncbi:MAG: hypothetical protein K8F91_18835 [Candidatus Obscuribacterales bacterium]|nr:hypothetical protein [Candidatus Obscuribacterales bacterium]